MNTPKVTESLNLKAIKRVVDSRVTAKITSYSDPIDVRTLSNGMQVGRLSTKTRDPYGYAMLVVGDFSLNPCGPYGKAALERLYACLCMDDCSIVANLAYKVQMERVSTGNRRIVTA